MRRYYRTIFILGDFICINILFWIFLSPLFIGIRSLRIFSFLPLLNILWLLIIKYLFLYRNLLYMDSVKQYTLFLKAFFLFTALGLLLLYSSFPPNMLFTTHFIVNVALFFVTLGFNLWMMRLVMLLYRKKYLHLINKNVNTVVVGENNFSSMLLDNRELKDTMGIRGVFNINPNFLTGLSDGRLRAVKRLLRIDELHNVIICDDMIGREDFQKIMNIANRHLIRMYVIPDFKGLDLKANNVISFNGIPFVKPLAEPLEVKENSIYKRIFDVIFSFMVIILVMSWLTPLIALLIKLEDGGPVFFRQKRSGYLNEEFCCLKFRSMKLNDDADQQKAVKSDCRVTRVGRFLRKTSIDEFPQFFNVLMGDMSIVGPRPHMLSQTDTYTELVKKYMVRHFVKPGITGWAQVSGSRGEISETGDMAKRVEKDIWYIQHWSMVLDLKIVFLTVLNIVKGDKQAY